jgi:MFS family permease
MFYSPLRYPLYRDLWLVGFFSNIGSWIQTVTASILITELTHSALLIGLIQTMATAPLFIFAIPAGILADIYDRKRIILYAQIFMLLIALLMAMLSYLGYMNAWLLISMTFLLNAGLALNLPAWQANSSTLIPPNEIKNAVALNNLNYNLTRCIGPGIAGYLFASLGPVWLFSLNSLSFIGIIWLFFTHMPSNSKRQGQITFTKIKQGFRQSLSFFKDYPSLKYIILKSALYFSITASLWTLLPYMVIVHYKLPSSSLGLLTMAAGLGALINPYILYHLRQHMNDNQLTTLSFIGTALILFYLDESSQFNVFFMLMFLFGFIWSLSISIFHGIIQGEFHESIRSRLIGTYFLFFAGFQALGGYLGAVLTHIIGLDNTIWGMAGLAFMIGVAYYFIPTLSWQENLSDNSPLRE